MHRVDGENGVLMIRGTDDYGVDVFVSEQVVVVLVTGNANIVLPDFFGVKVVD